MKIKDFITYNNLAKRTDKMDCNKDYYFLQISCEFLELMEFVYKKNLCLNINFDNDIKKELGDIFWFLFAIVRRLFCPDEFFARVLFFDGSIKTFEKYYVNEYNNFCDNDSAIFLFNNSLKELLDYYIHCKYHGHFLRGEGYQYKVYYLLCKLVILTNYLGFSVQEILDLNIEKLKKRYKNGYSDELSRNRCE